MRSPIQLRLVAFLSMWLPAHALADTFPTAVAAAWARLPERDNIDAAAGVANARVRAGSAIFPNAPYADGEYDDDRLGSNDDYRTTRIEIGTPVWLPGEGGATVGVGAAQGEAVVAERNATHLALAGRVLALSLEDLLATDRARSARSRLATDRAVASALRERFRVGENSQSDALAADAEEAASETSLDEAETSRQQAAVSLASITGSEEVPTLAQAPSPDLSDALLSRHPSVVAASLEVRAAEAEAHLVRIADRDDPDLGLQVTNDKQPGSPWDTRVGIVFHIPFASAARNAPLRAAAEQKLVEAESRLTLARRGVVAAAHDALLRLASAERLCATTARTAADLDRRRTEIEHAWRVGEMPTIELVRADAVAADADLSRDEARTRRDAARWAASLAAGILP